MTISRQDIDRLFVEEDEIETVPGGLLVSRSPRAYRSGPIEKGAGLAVMTEPGAASSATQGIFTTRSQTNRESHESPDVAGAPDLPAPPRDVCRVVGGGESLREEGGRRHLEILREARQRRLLETVEYPLDPESLETQGIPELRDRMPDPGGRFEALRRCLDSLPFSRRVDESTLLKVLKLGRDHGGGVPVLGLVARHIGRARRFSGDPDTAAAVLVASRGMASAERSRLIASLVSGRSNLTGRARDELTRWIRARAAAEDLGSDEADACAEAAFFLLRGRTFDPEMARGLVDRLASRGHNRRFYDLTRQLVAERDRR